MNWQRKGNLDRLALIRTPWFRVFIHKIREADPDRDWHCHPWLWMFSIVLRGWYTERRRGPAGNPRAHIRTAGDLITMEFYDYHRITSVGPSTYTLFVAGPRVGGGWGFLDKAGKYRKANES